MASGVLPSVKQRKGFIGGSDAATCLALAGAFLTQLELYRIFIGEVESEDTPAIGPDGKPTPMHVGTVLEDALRTLYRDTTGRKVQRVGKALVHPDYPWMRTHLDGRVVGTEERRILECKNRGGVQYSKWADGPPPVVVAQCQHNLAVSKADVCDVPVLLGGNDFRVFEVWRDAELIDTVIGAERAFVENYCIPKVPPPPQTHADFAVQFAEALEGKGVPASAETLEQLEELVVEIKPAQKRLDALRKYLELEIKMAMGDAEALFHPETKRTVCTLKNSKPSTRLNLERLKRERPDIFQEFAETPKVGPRKFYPKPKEFTDE